MASSVKHFCTICEYDGISNTAVTWCTECEVFFCGDCEKTHSKSGLSKHHKTMSADNYKRLPTFMQEIRSQCRDHNTINEFYCSFHACPCCVQCVTDKHKKCQDMKPLSDTLHQVKSSASVQLFEKDLKNVKENLDTAIMYLKTRISTINIQKTKAIEEISYMRKSINDNLNKLEQNILNDLESKHSKLRANMATILQQMEQGSSQIDQMQSQFTNLVHHATELQMYIGLKEIEKTAKYIGDLERTEHFIEKNLEVNISSALQSFLQDVKSFGDININTTSSTLRLKTGRKDQAHHLVPEVPGIEQIKPSLLTRLTSPKDMKLNIWACHILPDSRIMILDNNKKQLVLFSNDGIFIRNVVTFTKNPCDVCFVRNYTVAVTLRSANQIALVDVEKNKIIQTIKLSHECYGVASDGKTLVITSGGSQCTTVNLNDMSHTILEGMQGVGPIALFQGNIYGINYHENKVSCYRITGEHLWTYQNPDVAKPRGLSLDKNGFVYIASNGNNSIMVVSPDGRTCKRILSGSDGIKDPWQIDINRETGIMIVSSRKSDDDSVKDYETAFVYKI
ncbi:unnamed protein product [Mytilus edulis]|uniref:B box-type domain-containing protein n=1 Tax=Mytilus edulis TaxID=6550 RepID=A0A8S3VG35_MYTED|nr:unnamed protein product [Mytilus edulis]